MDRVVVNSSTLLSSSRLDVISSGVGDGCGAREASSVIMGDGTLMGFLSDRLQASTLEEEAQLISMLCSLWR